MADTNENMVTEVAKEATEIIGMIAPEAEEKIKEVAPAITDVVDKANEGITEAKTPDESIKKATIQNRLKSKILWAGVASLILLVLKNSFGIEIPHADAIVDVGLGILGTLGVVNNPTNPKGF